MSDRTAACETFLHDTGLAGASRTPVSGDASNRRYERLHTVTRDGRGSVILMDAPAERGEDVRPFVRIARHLTGLGLSAPQVLHENPEGGFLILEDLGDDLYARILAKLAGRALEEAETRLYSAATDVLIALHRAPMAPGLKPYRPAMPENAGMAFDWYAAAFGANDAEPRTGAVEWLAGALDSIADAAPAVTILRDYHAENLLWLPDRDGVARVGLLDFQDAMIGHPAYDLVSMLQDARRDVSPAVETAMIARYCAATGLDAERFAAAYNILGAQRNLRILGVFARLCLRDGKAHYVDFIPRVWGLLQRDLSALALAPLAAILRGALPEPTSDRLQSLRDRCGQTRTA